MTREISKEVYDAVMTIREAGWDVPDIAIKEKSTPVEQNPSPVGLLKMDGPNGSDSATESSDDSGEQGKE